MLFSFEKMVVGCSAGDTCTCFTAGAFVGSGYWMSRGGYAKPLAPENGDWHNNMMNYMHNQSNWDDMAHIMSSPENRKAMADIMSSPQMRNMCSI